MIPSQSLDALIVGYGYLLSQGSITYRDRLRLLAKRIYRLMPYMHIYLVYYRLCYCRSGQRLGPYKNLVRSVDLISEHY